MNIEPKTELERLREQLEGCLNDLVIMGSPEGQPALIAVNIRHKQAQARKLEERIRAMEGRDPSPAAQDDRQGAQDDRAGARDDRGTPPWA